MKLNVLFDKKSILQVPSGNQIEHSFDANIHGLIHPSVRSYQQL